MFLNNRKNIAAAGGILVLAAVGAAAWIHKAENRPATAPAAVADGNFQPGAAQSGNAQPGQLTASAATATPAVSAQPGSIDGYYASVPPPVYINQPQPPAVEQPVAAEYAAGQPAPQYEHYTRYRGYRHKRSKLRSIEIVAGTAAAGAAIGAIAGGGPGAAIGAISGAGAGFTYDRLTHNH